MKKAQERNKTKHTFIPNSVRFLSSCLKIVSSNVRSAGPYVACSISSAPDDLHNSICDWKTERYKEIIKSGTICVVNGQVEPRPGVLRLMDEAKAAVR